MNFYDDHDHETPDCPLCGERLGIHNDGKMILAGQFFYNQQDGYAMFILDPDTKMSFLELPDALGPGQSQFAIIIDAADPAPVMVMHTPCLDDEITLVADEDPDDVEDLDEQMIDAMSRDDDTHWDDHDMLTTRR